MSPQNEVPGAGTPIRTGLTKVGLPGAKLGLQPEDPTIWQRGR